MKAAKPGKSPGPDGFLAQYYKSFADLLAPEFLRAFNTLSHSPCISNSLLEAYISVIPKDNKDPTNIANYRPISLLNVDVKLFAKILATRLSLHLMPWFSKKHIPANVYSHPFVSATLHAFDRALKVHSLSITHCAITPVKGNPDFPPGMEGAFLAAEWPYAKMQAKHFFSRGQFLRQSLP